MRPFEIVLSLGCLLLLMAAGFVLRWAWAAPELPRPPGGHQVGSVTVHLGTGRGGLEVQWWYPAREGGTGLFAPYPSDSKIKTHAVENADVAETETGWPVVLYSPSWEGRRFENTALCEALASEGFVVAAIDYPRIGAQPPLDFSSAAATERFQAAAARELDTRTSDLLRVFAALPELDRGGRFKNKLDSDRVAALGYSFGGAVAAEACRREPRLRAAVDLDGTLFGQAARDGAPQPFLVVTDAEPPPSESERHSPDAAVRRAAEFYTASYDDIDRWLNTRGGWLVSIDGVHHGDFCDQPLLLRSWNLSGSGCRNARQTFAVIETCVSAFLDQTLRGRPSVLLEKSSSPWPGVEVRRFEKSR